MLKFNETKNKIEKYIGKLIYQFLKTYAPYVFKFNLRNEYKKRETAWLINELLKVYGNTIFKIGSEKEEERNEVGRLLHETIYEYNKNIFAFNPVACSGNNEIEESVKLYEPYMIMDSKIGKGTYIATNSIISMTTIGKFCSIGPNLTCGFGLHPTSGISTSPCFYSTEMQNGMTFSSENKVEERKPITIGNDVFIGMNVSIIDGVTIGDGAVIAAGAVVNKDVAPYSVVGGVPAKFVKYRFEEEQIEKLLQIRWWNWDNDKLQEVEKNFFDIDKFISENS